MFHQTLTVGAVPSLHTLTDTQSDVTPKTILLESETLKKKIFTKNLNSKITKKTIIFP